MRCTKRREANGRPLWLSVATQQIAPQLPNEAPSLPGFGAMAPSALLRGLAIRMNYSLRPHLTTEA